MRSSLNIFALIFIALVVISPNALAFGISPASKTFDTPGQHAFTVVVHNNGDNGTLLLRVEGDLANATTLSSYSLPFTSDTTITGTITIPGDIIPGDHEQRIIAKIQQPNGELFTVSSEITSLLIARRSYSGPYLVIDAQGVPDDGALDTTNMIIVLDNRGDAAAEPTITLVRESGDISVPAATIPPRQVKQFGAQLHGRGVEQMTLVVNGAQSELRKNITVIMGRPVITGLAGTAQQETGLIKPIVIEANLSWNKPVTGQLTIGKKTQQITIDKQFKATVYAETQANDTAVPVELVVGRDRMAISVPLTVPAPITPPVKTPWLTIMIAVILLLIVVILLMLYLRSRPKRPSLAEEPSPGPQPAPSQWTTPQEPTQEPPKTADAQNNEQNIPTDGQK